MSFRMPTGPGVPRVTRVGRGPRLLLPVLLGVVALLILGSLIVSIYTNVLWYRSVGAPGTAGFARVYATRIWTQVLLFVVFGLLTGVAVAANVVVAYRLRPPFRPISAEQQSLERYRIAIDPYRRWLLLALGALLALIEGSSAAAHWRTWLLWRNGQSFGHPDPQFHRDVSYFTFTYPFQRFLLGAAFFVVVVALLTAAVVHYVYGGLRLQTPGDKLTPAARAHLSVLLGLFVLLKAVAYWLDRYGLSFSRRGFVDTGASYTDVNAVLPAKTILVVVAVICALLFFANLFSRGWLLPAAGFGLLVFAALVIGGIYPAVIQHFQVKPSEVDKERPYIARHIAETRAAYGLRTDKDVVYTPYAGTATGNVKALRADTGTLPNLRVLDPTILPPTYQQLQGFKGFYTFPDPLDVDRYTIGGRQQEEVVGVRDINVTGLAANQQNWINEHLVYTHGYGFVAAPSQTVDAQGQPEFNESGIPVRGVLPLTQPRVYFGESSPPYSIVGAPTSGGGRELDFPTNAVTGQQNTSYDGRGGVPMGSPFRRLLYALKFKEKNLLLSSGVNADSRILYERNPRDRVQAAAPWLTLDGDPYPAVVGGRIMWIIDGYTTSNGFPYSERTTLGEVTQDTTTTTGAVAAQPQAQVNYIRNSVKAVVDGYDGSVTLYQWGPRDPVLETWKRAFPGTVRPESAIPADLRAHLRYPEDLFKVQRDLLRKFHIDDPAAFYNGSDYWLVPDDPTQRGTTDQPPYYLTFAMPGERSPSFQLTTALLANNKKNLAAFVAVECDPARSDYGVLKVLKLPGNAPVDGPGQVQNNFNSYTPASTELSLLSQRGSDVDYGNLLTLPLGTGMLYVEPIYIKSTGTTSYPLLHRVLASYNGVIAYKPTLGEALDAVLGASSAASSGPPSTGTTPPPSGTLSAAVRQAIDAANRAYAESQIALSRRDFTAYGEAQRRLQQALQQLAALTRGNAGTTRPSASPSAAATRPSASPLAASPAPSP